MIITSHFEEIVLYAIGKLKFAYFK